MIKHIVFWNLNEHNRDENLMILKSKLEDLPNHIPEIQDYEVGINFNPAGVAFEVVLYSSFENKEALETYQQHPRHQEVIEFVKEIVSGRAVVDYEV